MKKRKSILLSFVLTIALSLSACVQKAEMKESVESVSEITESVGEVNDNGMEVAESESEEKAEVAENVTLDMDLSFLGEIVKDLFVVTNDKSKLKTEKEVMEYFYERNYSFYGTHTVDEVLHYDQPITYEELVTYGKSLIIRPDDLLQYSGTPECSHINFTFNAWKDRKDFTDSSPEEKKLQGIHYAIQDCSAETVAAAKEYFYNVLASDIFDNVEYEIIYYDADDENNPTTWRGIDLLIKGKPVNPGLNGMFFACLSISITEEQILIGLSLM